MRHIFNIEEGNHHPGCNIYVSVTCTVFPFAKQNVCNITKCEKNDGV